MDLNYILERLSPSERKILPYLKKNKDVESIILDSGLSIIEVMHALQWLSNKDLLTIEMSFKSIVSLGSNGYKYLTNGLPERVFVKTLSGGALTLEQIKTKSGLSDEEVNVCIGLLRSKGVIETIKDHEIGFKLSENGRRFIDREFPEEIFIKKLENPMDVSILNDIDKFSFENLKKRKDIIKIEDVKIKVVTLTKDCEKLLTMKIDVDLIEKINENVLKNEEWKVKKFRVYDIDAKVPKLNGGRRHPYNESLNIIRNIFLEMGFQEMEGPWVETAFWGMDSMWIAQDHPMREVQDTFYLDRTGDLPDRKFVQKIKAAHEEGYNTGSIGHTKKWDPEIASKLILRQHSTATTFRYFYKKKLNCNCKYFYIADNFRNEASDATHLPEFGQAEGFIMADNLTLADLMGFVKEFYAKLGITKIKFKPTFNPYTEPSMEAHYYDEKMGGWFALINSGIFRPEALAPYGITKSVLAWGMGSSRMAAILTGKKKLRELFGPGCDFDWIRHHKRVK
jgi:phenylalanyl-tRNA synthetase alpha chain